MNRLSVNVRSIPWLASIRRTVSREHRGVSWLKPSLWIIFGLGLSICTCLLGISSLVSAQSVPVDAILPTPPNSTAAPAVGQFAVSDGGAATYSYPIWVPDGRRNLQPSLSLVYNSQVENGLLGVGWGLSGLSSITRCKRDMARDDFNSTIQFNWNDRFCLDGQRLVSFPSVTDGITRNYGTERAEYRTEQEGFAQIINGPVDAKGPLWFEVRLKNGLILLYGTTPDSRPEGQRMNVIPSSSGGTVGVQRDFSQIVRLTWALSEVRDRFGNNMTLHYSTEGDAWQGYEHLPVSIHYTGTVDQSLPARREIRFTYEPRPDTRTSFMSGLKLAARQRLSKITLAAPNPVDTKPVKEYVLQYEVSTATKRSLLQKISECDPQAVCLTPTTFAYSFTAEDEDRFTDIGTDIHDVTTGSQGGAPSFGPRLDRLITGDINGDGCDDLIYTAVGNLGDPGFPGGRRAAYRLSGCRFLSGPPSPATSQQLTWPLANAPNSTILAPVFNPPYRGPEDTKECLVPSGDVVLKQCYAQLTGIDLDLDSRMDLFSQLVWEDCGKVFPPDCGASTSWNQTFDTRILLASSIPPVQWNPSSSLYGGMTQFSVPTHTNKAIFHDGPPASWSYISTYIGDINGDGYPDLMKLTPNGWSYQLNHGRASGQVLHQPNCGATGRPCLNLDAPSLLFPGTAPIEGLTNVFMTDVFREGTSSLILRDSADKKWYAAYRLSARSCPDGQAFCPIPARNLGLMAGDAYFPPRRDWFLDVNGDGLPDSVSLPLVGGSSYISINTGNGFDAPVEVPSPGVKTSSINGVLDYDGNGTQDLLVTRQGELSVMLTNEQGGISRTVQLPIQGPEYFITAGSNLQTFDVNGDGRMDLIQILAGRVHAYVRLGSKPDLLTSISADRGGAISVSYAPLTRRGLYSTSVPPGVVASSAPSSTYVMNKGPWVVESYSVPRAGYLWGQVRNQYSYTYADGRHDLSGRGWLGFGSVTTVDHQTQAKTIRTYDNATKVGSAYPLAHRLQSVTHIAQLSNSGRTSQRKETTFYQRSGTDDGRYSVVVPREVVHQESEGPSVGPLAGIRQIKTLFDYDNFGNVTKTSSVTGDGYSEDRVFSYQQNLNAWLVSMPTRAVFTSIVPGGARGTRTSSYSPDPNTGLTLEEIVEPDGDHDTYLQITHHYDAHGVQTDRTVTDKTGSVTRCATVQYDTESIYPTVSVNTLGHSTRVAIHPALGTTTLFEDANGVREKRQYDTFGRLRTVLPANGANLSVAYTSSTGFPIVEATDASGQVTRISYDAFQHVIEKTWKAFDGQTVAVRTSYNGQNLLAETLGPCYLAPQTCSASGSEQYAYDELGRLLTVTHADGSARTVTYTNLQASYLDELGNQRSMIEDQLGRLVKSLSITAEGREVPTTYRYAPFGLLASITDPANNTVDTQYDIRGRVRTLHEQDFGSQAFQWSPFGDLRESRDGNNRVTTYHHDGLGRVIKVANPDGITQFRWDTAAHGIGLLDRSKSRDGIESVYTYDALARTNAVASTIDGKAYELKMTYDGLGRLSTLAYPEVPNHTRFAIRQQYNAFGYLQQVVDESSQFVYWRVDRENERGQLVNETFGNGLTTSRRFDTRGLLRKISTGAPGNTIQDLTYDYWPTGSLQSRTTRFPESSLVETFIYDPLDRLTKWSAYSSTPNASQPEQLLEHIFKYDDLGNLLLRSMSSPGGPGHTFTYQYGEHGAGPHAVTHVNDDAYVYDPGGNQITGPGRTINYTSFDLPSRIVTASKQFDFQYDAFHIRSVISDSTGDRTTYIGGLYEKRLHNGQTTHVFYVPGLSGIIAQIERDETTGKQSILYLHHDRLASVQASTDQTGTVTGRANYEPFGGVVDAADPSKSMPNALGGVTLGFTEHSMDAGLNLINMTGRIYDPTIGRFLTPDPLTSDPVQSESLNPYSYVWNNPLKWVDPSGFEPKEEEEPKKKKGEEKPPQRVKLAGSEVIVVIGNRRTGKSTTFSFWETIGTGATYDDNGRVGPSMPVRPGSGCEIGCQLAQGMVDPNTGPRPFTHFDKAALGYLAAAPMVVMAGAITSAVATIEAGVTVYQVAPRAWKAVLGVLSGFAGQPQSAPEAAAAREPSRIYSARELIRRAEESGPHHNFPESFNRQIFQEGTRTVTPDFFNVAKPGLTRDSVMYELRGSINGSGGTFEIGVRPSISGAVEVIVHRFFQPD